MKKWLSLGLALVMALGLLTVGGPVASAASGTGTWAGDPRVVDSYVDFKAAMEDSSITYVKLTATSETLPTISDYAAGITVAGPQNNKVLTIEGTSDFWASQYTMESGYDCLIRVPGNVTLTVGGSGTLKFASNLNNGYNSVIRNDGTCKISDVTLSGYTNGSNYGYAVVNSGNLDIYSGSFYGETAFDGAGPFGAVLARSGNTTIMGGIFSSKIYDGAGAMEVTAGTNALVVESGASCSLSGGMFYSGINAINSTFSALLEDQYFMIDNSGKTVSTNQSRYNRQVAVTANRADITDSIVSVDVKVAEPKIGQVPESAVSVTGNVTVSTTEWYCNDEKMSSTDTFKAGNTYRVHVIVNTENGYSFGDTPTVTFNGSKDGTVYVNGPTYINYYAEFTASDGTTIATYTITFNPIDGTVSPTKATTGADGKLASFPTPTREGYTFTGWYAWPTGNTLIPEDTVFTKDSTVYAHWKEKAPATYTITFNPMSGKVSPTTAVTGTDGKLASFPTPTKEGYTFTGWYAGPKGDTVVPKDTVFTEDTTVYAHWKEADPTPTDPSAPITPHSGFKDVPVGAYFSEAVAWAVDKAITQGTGADTFSPNATCTRGQVVTFLWRAAGSPAPAKTDNPFTDVDKSAYYADAVLWAVEKGITNGATADTFAPDQGCTRGQVVTFLHRFEETPAASSSAPFADVADTAYYAKAVAWAVEKNVTQGTGANTFSPDATCTRGQIVTFLYRDMK